MRCLVPGCKHVAGSAASEGITFHKFPSKTSQRVAWLDALGFDIFSTSLPANSAVCSLHFFTNDLYWTSSNQRILRVNAVPIVRPQAKLEELGTIEENTDLLDDIKQEIEYPEETEALKLLHDFMDDGIPFEEEGAKQNLKKAKTKIDQAITIACDDIKTRYSPENIDIPNPVTGDDTSEGDASSGDSRPAPMATRRGDARKMGIGPASSGQKLSLGDKMRRRPSDVFTCYVCGKAFKLKSNLEQHLTTHSKKKPHHCKICKKQFKTKSYLEKHMVLHSKRESISCELCQKFFVSRDTLKSHMKIHSGKKPIICSICKKSFMGEVEMLKHALSHFGVKLYTCNICFKKLSEKSLRAHMRAHSSERPHSCDKCDKTFVTQAGLKQHSAVHAVIKAYSCEICKADFAYKSYLQSHMRRKHSSEKPFSCDLCKKSFSNKSNFKTHLESHSSEKPHSCVLCNKEFKFKRYLRNHMSITHSDVRKYACHLCEKAYKHSFGLKIHLRSHAGDKRYSCDQCDKKYYRLGWLKHHLKKHTGEKISLEAFSRKNKVVKQLKTHSSDRPFKCVRRSLRIRKPPDKYY